MHAEERAVARTLAPKVPLTHGATRREAELHKAEPCHRPAHDAGLPHGLRATRDDEVGIAGQHAELRRGDGERASTDERDAVECHPNVVGPDDVGVRRARDIVTAACSEGGEGDSHLHRNAVLNSNASLVSGLPGSRPCDSAPLDTLNERYDYWLSFRFPKQHT